MTRRGLSSMDLSRRSLVALALLVAALVVAMLTGGRQAVAVPGGSAHVQPEVSAIGTAKQGENNPDNVSALLGPATAGAPGEAWAFRQVPGSQLPPVVNGSRLQFATSFSRLSQPAFYRYMDSTGWQLVEVPLGADSSPMSSFSPILSSAAVTPHGGGELVGNYGNAIQILIRQPGGTYKVTPPPSSVLHPAAPGQPQERLAAGVRAPATAYDVGTRTQVLATATGSNVEAILHYDGTTWSREEAELPVGHANTFKVLAIDSTGPENAWLLADLDPALGRGISLFHRDTSGATPTWHETSLAGSFLAEADSPSLSISNLRAIGQTTATAVGVDPLTVTSAGLWIDGRFDVSGQSNDFTAFYRFAGGQIAGSWCDPAAGIHPCDHDLGARFSSGTGYRSTAWSGSGFGTRVITAPLDASGNLSSNRGTFLSLSGENFVRVPGIGDSDKATSALASATSGWISPNAKITDQPAAAALSPWSVGTRAPFTAVAPEPDKAVGASSSQALAVGANGTVARYTPASGWSTEFLLSSSGLVRRPDLRAVAWPESGRAHAVGDAGEMWLWRGETGLWERDPGAPLGLSEQLTDIAFNPSDPTDGYAIGRNGTILHYGKSWTKVCPAGASGADCDESAGEHLPAEITATTRRAYTFTKIAFSGGDPIVIGSRVDGSDALPKVLVRRDGKWQWDTQLNTLLDAQKKLGDIELMTVSGLPDGGAFIAGKGIALQRESRNATWQGVEQPLPSTPVIASSLFRESGQLRALVSVTRVNEFSQLPADGTAPEGVPAPLLLQLIPSGEGMLLRQTASGWTDIEQQGYLSNKEDDVDRPFQPPAIQAILATSTGDAWVVGGVNGYSDASGFIGYQPGSSASLRQRISTSYIGRYGSDGGAQSGRAVATPVSQSSGTANFVVAGNATCENPECQDFANNGIAPDQQLTSALDQTAKLAGEASGPRFFMYTGGRRPSTAKTTETSAQAARLALLLGHQPSLPVYSALAAGDSTGGSADAWTGAFANFPAPLGDGAAPTGIKPLADTGGSPAHTHYVFESGGNGGTIRVIVIDNSRGSLADSDPYQHPAVGSQFDWLRDQLRAAKAAGVPAVVVGHRDLNESPPTAMNVATDARAVSTMIRDEGASAYFFDRPEENRTYPIPAGEALANTIPSFGTGTLGYRAENDGSTKGSSAFFGNTGMLLAQVDISARNPSTNRAPVSVRMIPLVSNLNIDAIDGTFLRRSRPALFSGLAARPQAGDRWGANQAPAGSDPYTVFPTPLCKIGGCASRIPPEYSFTSSDPDIANFVAVDPQSSNIRKPLIGSDGKPVADQTSGLLCAYNAGTTTVSISAGGQTFSRQITVQPGSVQPPCGTVPLSASRFTQSKPNVNPPNLPPTNPASPVINLVPPPVPPAVTPPSTPIPHVTPPAAFVPVPLAVSTVPVVPPPPPPSLARPIPPTGGMARAPERQKDEEVATEDSQAFATYRHDDAPNVAYSLAALILIGAFAGASLPRARRGRGGGRIVPATVTHENTPSNWRRPR